MLKARGEFHAHPTPTFYGSQIQSISIQFLLKMQIFFALTFVDRHKHKLSKLAVNIDIIFITSLKSCNIDTLRHNFCTALLSPTPSLTTSFAIAKQYPQGISLASTKSVMHVSKDNLKKKCSHDFFGGPMYPHTHEEHTAHIENC